MIVASFILVLVSLVLLVVGVAQGSIGLVVGSIVATVVAFGALYIGIRQRARLTEDDSVPPAIVTDDGRTDDDTAVLPAHTPPRDDPDPVVQPAATAADPPPSGTEPSADYEVPADEPPPELTSDADALRIGGRREEVQVVDGRPRYHLAGCRHLTGREPVGLPVSEARDAGFTPCGLCAPDAALLGRG